MKTNKRKKGIQAFDEGLKRTFEKAVEAGEVITRYSDMERSGKRTEWVCQHGTGHHKGVHGCDGCCSKAPKDMWDKVPSDKEYSKTDHIHCFDIKKAPCGLQVRHRCCLCGEPVPESSKEKKYDFIWNGKLHKCKYEDHEGFGPCNFCEVVESDKEVCGIMLHTRGFGAGKGAVYCAETKPCKFHESGKRKCVCGEQELLGNGELEIGGVCHRPNNPCYCIVAENAKGKCEESEKRMILESQNINPDTGMYIERTERNILVYSKKEWLSFGYWTEKELDNADKNGYIGMKHGVDCYLARPIPWVAENTLEGWYKSFKKQFPRLFDFPNISDDYKCWMIENKTQEVRDFIRQLLEKKEEEGEEYAMKLLADKEEEVVKVVKGMKKNPFRLNGDIGIWKDTEVEKEEHYIREGYNKALGDVASRIRSNKK
jgi:hypothetical protein